MQYFLLTVFSMLLLLFGSVHKVHALVLPAFPDPWFVTTIDFNEATLPEGVSIIKDDYEYVISNSSPNTFYLLGKNIIGDTSLNYEKYKVLENSYVEYYVWRDGSTQSIRQAAYNKPLRVYNSYFEEISGIPDDNIEANNRPKDVKIPPPKNFQFEAVHNNQRVIISGTYTYALNPNYDPHAGRYSSTRERYSIDWSLLFSILGISIVFSLVLTFISKKILFNHIQHKKLRVTFTCLFFIISLLYGMFLVTSMYFNYFYS